MALNIREALGAIGNAWFRKHEEEFPGPRIQFGSLVTLVKAKRDHKLGPAGEEALFLGWGITPGM